MGLLVLWGHYGSKETKEDLVWGNKEYLWQWQQQWILNVGGAREQFSHCGAFTVLNWAKRCCCSTPCLSFVVNSLIKPWNSTVYSSHCWYNTVQNLCKLDLTLSSQNTRSRQRQILAAVMMPEIFSTCFYWIDKFKRTLCVLWSYTMREKLLRHSWGECWEVIFRSSWRPEGFAGPKTNREGNSRSVHSVEIHCCCHAIIIPTLGFVGQPFCKALIIHCVWWTLFVSVAFVLIPSYFLCLSILVLLVRPLPLLLLVSPVSAGLCECQMWCHLPPAGAELRNWTARTKMKSQRLHFV